MDLVHILASCIQILEKSDMRQSTNKTLYMYSTSTCFGIERDYDFIENILVYFEHYSTLCLKKFTLFIFAVIFSYCKPI